MSETAVYTELEALLARRHPVSVGYGMGYTPKLLFCTETPSPFHDFSFNPSINENKSFCTNAKQSVRWKLFMRPVCSGNC
jgi:hypothetical protein